MRHLIMGQITTTQNLVAIKEVRHAGQQEPVEPILNLLKIFFPSHNKFDLRLISHARRMTVL